jgi:signal transduction histidine kinase
MAQRLRELDWSKTALGEPGAWPQNLRTALSLCLSSRFPILIWWGADFRILYNDAYIPFLGATKHPAALAQPGQICWREIWGSIGPMLEGVYRSGQATWSHDAQYFFDRSLPHEEVYVTFTYGPILAADGVTVEGVFCPCTETTEKIVSARRLEILRKLGAQPLRGLGIKAPAEAICGVMSESRMDVPFCLIYRCGDLGPELLAATGVDAPQALTPAAWPLGAVAQAAQPQTIALAPLDLELPGGPWEDLASWARLVPISWTADGSVSGIMVLGVGSRRPLDEAYRDFLDLVAHHAASAIANAAAYEQESRRAEALAELDRAKTTFFSNVSHEFRTPLTLILGPLEQALGEQGRPLDPESLQMLHRNALRLQKLVNSLLDFSRIEGGAIVARSSPTDLVRATTEHASAFRSMIEAAGLKLRVQCDELPDAVWLDRDLYEKILLNLLSNAFKYTLQGAIDVILRDCGASVALSVRDTGVGIASDELPRIFERFHRIENAAARTHEGTGIGLALVRELVALLGGAIEVESQPGVGSVFTVTLPKGEMPDLAAPAHASPSTDSDAGASFLQEAARWGAAAPDAMARLAPQEAGGGRPAVLCIDDNADMRDYLHSLLAPRYALRFASDGASALQSARREPPDLVISDVMMPGMNGLSLLQALRADDRTRSVPVILLSARAGEEARVEGMQAGADDYLVKPFAARELQARVDAHLRLALLRREAYTALRANERRLRAILDQLPVGVGVCDASGAWMLANALMERCSPCTVPSARSEQAARWRGWDEHGEPVPPENWPARRALRGEMVVPGTEMQYMSEDGEERWMRVSAAPLRADDGELVGACTVVQDVTELMRAEQELRLAHDRKDEFLAVLAHELRNPLAPLHNGLQLLRLSGTGDEQTRRLHDMLARQATHMARLVDDLLDIARITNGKILLRKNPVDLTEVLLNALETCREAIEAQGHELCMDVPEQPLMVEADGMRLAQVVSNLLNNAAKYTDRGGKIRVRAYREADGNLLVSVRDNGHGIPASMLALVFEPFAQVDRERGAGGLGIGLTLVRRLVELHGGTVEARSEGLGAGAEFLVRLPASALAAAAPPQVQPVAATRSLGRILVVDDSPDSGDTTALVLQALGAEVRSACDGAAALALLDSFRPQVMLVDIGMPGMDGYEVARRVRAGSPAGGIVLIAMTGWGQEEDRRKSREAGFDHHLVKPMDFDRLERLLNDLQHKRIETG